MFPKPTPNKCILLLVRHGATDANLAQPAILQGRGINWGLADAGKQQAEQTARLLANVHLDGLYSSPLLRAQQTAQAIAKALPPDNSPALQTLEELTEVHAGRWEGRNWPDILQTDPEAYAQYMEDASRWGYPDGETITDVRNRVVPIFEKLMANNRGKRILVVAHNIVNRAFLANVLGLPLVHYRAIAQDNCCINIVEGSDKGTVLRSLNIVTHLQ